MISICMIGNSHVAAMRLAWEQIASEYPDIDAWIYGAHANTLVTAETSDDGKLKCAGPPFWTFRPGEEPGRARSIPLRDFDAVVLVGCDFGPIAVFRTYRQYHFSALKAKRSQGLTRDLFIRAMMLRTLETAALVLAGQISEKAGHQVVLVPAPLPSENGLLDKDKALMEPYQTARDSGDTEALMALFDEMCRRMERRGHLVVRQPTETLATDISTIQRFSDNSVKLKADDDTPHPVDDYFHMNAEYGALVWRNVIAAIRKQKAS